MNASTESVVVRPPGLTLNVGSSSVRLDAWAPDGSRLASKRLDRGHKGVADEGAGEAITSFVAQAGLPLAQVGWVAHRLVHGGPRTQPLVVDEAALDHLVELSTLAPLHNPPALAWLRAARERLAAATHVAVFDTAFFAGLPEAARTYALPLELTRAHGLRRYGFHGLAHEAMARRWQQLRPDLERGGRVVTLQLGSGCSAAAIDRGAPVDTSMGFSPLEGLVMASRPGDVDPGLVVHLQRALGLDATAIEELLNHQSGLRGLAGDDRGAGELVRASDDRARLAIDVFVHRARRYVGAFIAVLGGIDGLLFGGGIGEHVPELRERILAPLGFAGLRVDPARAGATGEARISGDGVTPEIWVVPVDEAQRLAEHAVAALA